MLEFKWAHWLEAKKKELKGETWSFDEPIMVFLDNKLIGGTKTFLNWAVEEYNYEDFRNKDLYETLRSEEYANYLKSTNVSLLTSVTPLDILFIKGFLLYSSYYFVRMISCT